MRQATSEYPAVSNDPGNVSEQRDQAYLQLLHRGLVLLRNCADGGKTELCCIEADHLHNLPTLVGETNERRHVYYLQAERAAYLQRLRESGHADYLEYARRWYAEPWRALATAAGLPLAE